MNRLKREMSNLIFAEKKNVFKKYSVAKRNCSRRHSIIIIIIIIS